MTKKIKKAVFPVGGLGTRFLPATKAIPKEMLPIVTKPLIQYAFEEAMEAGIEQFVFITGRNKNAISNHFDHAFELQSVLSEQEKKETLAQVKDWLPSSGSIAFIRQREPLGLGHAIWCARYVIGDEPFAVLLADEIVLNGKGLLKQMVEAYEEVGGNIVAVGEVEKKDVSKYGIIDPESKKGNLVKIKGMVEKPSPEQSPSQLSLTGRYILQPEIFNILTDARQSVHGEIQLTDAMSKMVSHSPFHGLQFEGKRFDCGSVAGYLEANIAYAAADKTLAPHIKAILKKYL